MLEHQSEFGIMRLGDLTLFDIRGYVSVDSGPAIKDAYDVIDHERAKKILLRADEDTYFNSGGLIAIFQILIEAKRNHQQIAITGLSKHFEKVFHMVGISKLASLYGTEKDVLKGLDLDKRNIHIPPFRAGKAD
jgi:anti-anti-sigma regulatory factor